MEFSEGFININKIFVLESLPHNDEKTGTKLFSDIIERRTWQSNLNCEFVELKDKSDLINILSRISELTERKVLYPFLHFEMHGFEEGVTLKNGERILFTDLSPLISSINKNINNNLCVSMSTCYGGNIQHIIEIQKPSPFRFLIGPNDEIKAIDLIEIYNNFFNELLLSFNVEKAINIILKQEIYRNKLYLFTAESLFDLILSNPKYKFIFHPKIYTYEINRLCKTIWDSNPNVKSLYKSKSKFLKSCTDKFAKDGATLIKHLRDNFLHVKYKPFNYL